MVDQQVLATQKWLNKTYRNVSGFKLAPENGLTGCLQSTAYEKLCNMNWG